MGHILSIILHLGLCALTAITLVGCGESKGGSSGGSSDLNLVSIEVTPGNPSIDLYATQQFKATGTFEDGSTRDVTTEVTWSTTREYVATANSNGLATSLSAGTVTVKATDTSTGISNTTGLSSGCTASVTNNGPVASGTDATVTLSLSCFSEATSHTCTTGSTRLYLSGPVDFEDSGDTTFTFFRADFAACGASGVTSTNCSENDGTPDVLEFNGPGGSGDGTGTADVTGIDATVYTDLQVDFRAAYAAATDAGEGIDLKACCGAGCTLALIGTAANQADGGTDAWSARGPFGLGASFDNCSSIALQLTQSSTLAGEVAHLDDYTLSGILDLSLSPQGGGIYNGAFTTSTADVVPVNCTWGTANGTFEADNTTNVQFN